MRIANQTPTNLKKVELIKIGECFTAPRSTDKAKPGYYIRIDANSVPKVISSTYRVSVYVLALNLETGQIRIFNNYDLVEPKEITLNV